MSKYFIFFSFIFLLSFTSSITLSMSPEQLDFSGEVGVKICDTAMIKTDGVKIVTGKILFSEEGIFERKLTKYKLSPIERGVETIFPKEIIINNETQIEICLNAQIGDYHGIILYKIKNAPVQVGIWINASFSGVETISISQKAGKKIKSVSSENLIVIIGIFWMIILGGLLIILLRKGKNYPIHKL